MTFKPCHPIEPLFATHAMAPVQTPTPRHITLIGFMGAGKSTVGQQVAAQLGLEFFDLDERIELEAKKSIAQIFRERGETAFRAHERAVLRHLLEHQDPIVLATGGGTYVDLAMRQMVQAASCAVIYLQVDAQSVLSRLAQAQTLGQRPLLDGPDPNTAVRRLLEARKAAYADRTLLIDTQDQSIQAVCAQVIAAVAARPEGQMKRGTDGLWRAEPTAAQKPSQNLATDKHPALSALPALRLDTPFSICGQSAAKSSSTQVIMRLRAGPWLGQAICQSCSRAKIIMLVTDAHVAAVHLLPLVQSLESLGRRVETFVMPPGETSKSLAVCQALWQALSQAHLDRGDAIVALGGGVVGDVTGFVASTYLRGLSFVQVPTTTLAAVDSSIGAKTAINTADGKNQLGSFYAPEAVLIAISHLLTQSRRQHAAGLVEAIKMGATHDVGLLMSLTRRAPELLAMGQEALADIIGRAVGIKASVIQDDLHDRGARATLNFGHTFGHAIEVGEANRLLHGEAVGLGMLGEAVWAEEQNLSRGVVAPIKEALLAMNMPVDWRRAKLQTQALQCDKKRLGTTIILPIVPELGRAQLHKASIDKLVAFVTDGSKP